MSKRDQGQGCDQKLDEITRLRLQHSLAEWTSFLGDWGGDDGLVMKDLYSVLSFDPLRNLHVEVSKLLKSRLMEYSSSDDLYSSPLGPAAIRPS